MSERPLPWDNWELLAETIGRGEDTPRHRAASAAIATLRSVLGENWLKGGAIPDEILKSFSHTIAFVRLLALAFRLEQFAEVPGFADMARSLRTDRTPDRWYHVQLQLELAELVAANGATVEFERGPKQGWPADVLAVIDGASVPWS